MSNEGSDLRKLYNWSQRARRHFDQRTKVGKEATKLIGQIRSGVDFQEIERKRNARRKLRQAPSFVNIFERPLVRDYLSNKRSLEHVHGQCLRFFGRNHWAKDAKDLRILEILKKHH
jgi:hypothetical protein